VRSPPMADVEIDKRFAAQMARLAGNDDKATAA
jgi:hypothetical protein